MKTTAFYQTDVYRIIQAMKATGNKPGMVRQWRELMQIWALDHPGADGDAMRAWIPYWRVRAVYTTDELAPIFPVLAVVFGFAQRAAPAMSANRLANLLEFGGLPQLKGVFQHPVTGQLDRWWVVERLHYYSKIEYDQTSFEKEFFCETL